MNSPMVARDYYLKQLIRAKDKPMVKVITGLRRSGKSVLLFNLFHDYLLESGVPEDHIIAIDLETQKNKPLRDSQKLYEYITSRIHDDGRHYVFLDEIQLAEDFEDVANGLMIDDACDVYLTGSNAKLLSKDINTRFRGRSTEIKVFPFSFSEYYEMRVKNGSEDKSIALNEFMMYGGLPYVWQLDSAKEKKDYLHSLNTAVLFRDRPCKKKCVNGSQI